MCLCTSLIACLVVCMSFCLWDPSGEQLRLVAHFAEQQQVHRLRLPHRFFFMVMLVIMLILLSHTRLKATAQC